MGLFNFCTVMKKCTILFIFSLGIIPIKKIINGLIDNEFVYLFILYNNLACKHSSSCMYFRDPTIFLSSCDAYCILKSNYNIDFAIHFPVAFMGGCLFWP